MKSILFKDRVFESKKDLFHALKDNEDLIIDLKKSMVYKSIDKGQGIINIPMAAKTEADKESYKSGFIYPIINSTHWMDMHDDVHVSGCYSKTVKEQQGKVYYIDSHLKGLSNIIARKQNITMSIRDVDWSMLGKSIEGNTQALVFEIAEENVKAEYLQLIKEDRDLQNSFAMSYVKIRMAVNSTDKAFASNKEVFEKYIGSIANKERAYENDYFFAVEELAIRGEGSLCPIIGGSNSATSVYVPEPEKSTLTDKSEPTIVTQSEPKEVLNLNFF